MTEEKKPLTLVFAPGCFDSFEGTQEELDAMMTEIQAMFDSGEMEANATEVDFDALMEEEPEFAEKLLASLDNDTGDGAKRNLQ